MIGRISSRTLLALAALTLAGFEALGAQVLQAPQVPRPTPAAAAAVPVLLPPPALAPRPPVRGAVRSVASAAPSALVTPVSPPRGSTPPDSITRGRALVALASPVPLVREAPRHRVRDFGPVRNDLARQPVPAGATGRCKDGTYLTAPANEEACAGKGGLSIRVPPTQAAPPTQPRRP